MVYTLSNPIAVGDLTNPITVDQLQLISISLNFEPLYQSAGKAILSVRLIHPTSGYVVNVTYQDATALDFWNTKMNAAGAVETLVLNKLRADGKLPNGTIT